MMRSSRRGKGGRSTKGLLLRQYKIPVIGDFVEALFGATIFVSVINFAMIAATFSFPLFVLAVIILILCGTLFTYKFLAPALLTFGGKQTFGGVSSGEGL